MQLRNERSMKHRRKPTSRRIEAWHSMCTKFVICPSKTGTLRKKSYRVTFNHLCGVPKGVWQPEHAWATPELALVESLPEKELSTQSQYEVLSLVKPISYCDFLRLEATIWPKPCKRHFRAQNIPCKMQRYTPERKKKCFCESQLLLLLLKDSTCTLASHVCSERNAVFVDRLVQGFGETSYHFVLWPG